MNRLTPQNDFEAIIKPIYDLYDCTIRPMSGFLANLYFGDHVKVEELERQHKGTLFSITFRLKVELPENHLKRETSKFVLTQAVPSWKNGSYEDLVLKLSPTFQTHYYLWAMYADKNSSTGYRWDRYQPGDTIIGEPEIRKESRRVIECFGGTVGSIVTFRLTRYDLVNYPVNILLLERFMAKYCNEVSYSIEESQGENPLYMRARLCNYQGRTVVGPDPTLNFGEICLPTC